ncbi:MAG: 4Fe-4S binding protein [Clostridia bacterium]|nr:4Fe-4S binding protein [Clostridia bacterium]
MFGRGLIKGLRTTWHLGLGKAITEQYPERRPKLPPAFHGSLSLDPQKCNACGLCARACPNNVIIVDSERGEDKKRYLSAYTVKLGQCLFCGLCVESCPRGALHWLPDFELACYRFKDTEHVLYKRNPEGEVSKGA